MTTIYNGMPPLPDDRRQVYDFYKISFTADGYPAKQVDDGAVVHPMYGSYVLGDYARQYQVTRRSEYRDALRRVAAATERRMTVIDDALAFYYEPDSGLSSYPGRYYSGLTQANYVVGFCKAFLATKEQSYLDLARRAFRALLIPSDEGGVYQSLPVGATIEEYPGRLPLLTLNGWLTTLRNIIYLRGVESRQAPHSTAEIDAVLHENLAALVKLLPEYDVPAIANSRYQLAGFLKIRLLVPKRATLTLSAAELVFPDLGQFSIGADCGNRWENGFLSGVEMQDGRMGITGQAGIMNVVLTRCPWSRPPRLRLNASMPQATKSSVQAELGLGDYDPLLSSCPSRRWQPLGAREVSSGNDWLEWEVDVEDADMLGYPTNFKKIIGGQNVNVYHKIHVVALYHIWSFCRQNSAFSAYREVVETFLLTWRGYMTQWDGMAIYRDAGVAAATSPFYSIPEVDGPLREAGLIGEA